MTLRLNIKTVALEHVASQNNYCIMKIKSLFLFTVLALFSSHTFSQDTKMLAKNLLNKTVSIICKDANAQAISLGSGVILGNDLVATNVHVIEGAKMVYIRTNSGTEIKAAGYVAIDKLNDLVILKIPNLSGETFVFSAANNEIGEQIFVAGNPSGLTGTFSDGLISGLRDFSGRSLIQISAPISPGSSGGPVVNRIGELIGISVGGISDGQNLNFCIPVKYLQKLKSEIGQATTFNIGKSLKKKTEAYQNVREGIIIRDIHFNLQFGKELESFSIYNALSIPVTNIKVLFIVYDSKGIPVDSREEILMEHEYIQPKLAKRPYLKLIPIPSMRQTDRLEIRILNFCIEGEQCQSSRLELLPKRQD